MITTYTFRTLYLLSISLIDHGRLVSVLLFLWLFVTFLKSHHLLSNLSLEQIKNSLWHFVLVTGLLFLGLTEVIVVHDARQDPLANSVNIILSFLGSNVQ